MESTPQPDDVGLDGAPEWVNSWMPQRHVEIATQIERLGEEAALLESLGQLLWQADRPLEEAVRDVFRGFGFQAELTPAEPMCDVMVMFGEGKRLLVSVTGTANSVTNKSPKIKQVFEAAQNASDGDRIVLAGNVHRERPFADREWLDPVTGEAMMILKGMGAVFVSTATLFRIWGMSHENPQTASEQLAQLYTADAGPFTPNKPPADLPFEESGESDVDESRGFADRLVSALKS